VSVKSPQSLEIPLSDRPDVGEGNVDRHGCFASLSLDTTECHDILARGNELFSDEVNVQSPVKAGEKSLEHILEAIEMAAADRHALWNIVDYVRRLETSQRLAMSWHGGFVESADALLVFF
jgi:hypothetical protein